MSLLEFEVFSNYSKPNKTWIGINDPSNSGKKENWRDVNNKKTAYVKQRVQDFNECFFPTIWTILQWYKTEPNGDGIGAYYNEKGVYDSNEKESHTVVCVQKIACK